MNFFPDLTVSCSVLFCCCSFNLKIELHNKSFIDQACSVKMPGYWPRSFFSAKKKKIIIIIIIKKNWPISSHLDAYKPNPDVTPTTNG